MNDDESTTYDQTERPRDDFGTALDALEINVTGWAESLNAEREFAEYLLAVAIQDLYIAGVLHEGQEVVNIAQRYWPLDTNINTNKKEN